MVNRTMSQLSWMLWRGTIAGRRASLGFAPCDVGEETTP